MEQGYEKIATSSITAAAEFDFSDCLPFGSNYFICGYTPATKSSERYYNHFIAIAFSLIGKIYGTSNNGSSNYHRGVAFIAQQIGVSKRQVKVLRKKYKIHGAYVFRTPYEVDLIVSKMIELLENSKADEMIVEYLKDKIDKMYREILIGEQFNAIEIAANQERSLPRVKTVYNKLNCITQIASR